MLRPALEGACILAAAHTGSGKTLAFGVPVLQRILLDIAKAGDDPQRRLLACLVPRGRPSVGWWVGVL